jgi:hypothetical protein
MIRKLLAGWSAYTLIYISVKLLALIESGIICSEYAYVAIVTITSTLIFTASYVILNEFFQVETEDEESPEGE